MSAALTIEQWNAVDKFARAWGRCWKAALRDAWASGRYRHMDCSAEQVPVLQGLRNTHGPSWLERYGRK